jgi:hypothetical protein
MSRPITLAVALFVQLAVRSAEPPDIVKIEDKGGKLTAPVNVMKAQQQVVTETVNVNGKPATRAVTRTVPVMVTESRVLDAEAGEFYTPAGEKLDPKKLGDVLKAGAKLAVSRDGKPLAAEEAKKHKDIVAVLIPKSVPIGKDVPAKDLMDEKPFAAEASVKDGSVVVARPLPAAAPAKQPRPRPTTRPSGAPPVEAPAPPAETFTLDPKRTQVLRMDGSVVQPADWAALLTEKTKVIVSPGGQVVPDEVRAANKEAVAVIVVKTK